MEKLLTVNQICELFQVSKRTVYDWVHIGYIPHYKLPKGIRFSETTVHKWLRSKEKKGRKKYEIEIEI